MGYPSDASGALALVVVVDGQLRCSGPQHVPNLAMRHLCRGGHVGFLSGALPLGRVWMDDVVAQFLAAALAAAPPRPPAAEPSPAAVQARAAGAAAATGLRRRCAKHSSWRP